MPVLVQYTPIRANAAIIPSALIRAELDAFTRDFCGDVVIAVAEYPPVPPPPNRYVRTGRLLRNWRVLPKPTGDQIKYVIDNPVQDKRGRYYASFVHGPGTGQVWFHSAHGWKNIADYRDRERFRTGVQAIIGKAGGLAI